MARTAIGNHRILRAEDGSVTFKYKSSDDGRRRILTLPAKEFLRRFLQHVLPKGFQRIRYYGWLGPAAKARWERILALLDYHPSTIAQTPKPEPLCRHCGVKLWWIATLERPPP